MEVTVKTLDSKVHSFKDLSEDITVKEFKQKIEPTVGVPASIQRLIFQGKVLKDDRPLKEFSVAGKVIHLVERAPPASVRNPTNNSQEQGSAEEPRGHPRPHAHAHHHHHHHHHGSGGSSGNMAGLFESLDLPTSMVNMTQSIVQGLMSSFSPSQVSSSRSSDGHSVNVQIDVSREEQQQEQQQEQQEQQQQQREQQQRQQRERDLREQQQQQQQLRERRQRHQRQLQQRRRTGQISERFVEARKCLSNATRDRQQMPPVTADEIIQMGEQCEERFESAPEETESMPPGQNPDFFALSRILYNVTKLNRQMDPVLRQLAMCLRFPNRLNHINVSLEADSLAMGAKEYFYHVGQCFRFLGDCCLLPSSEAPGLTPGRILASTGFGAGPPLNHPFQRMQIEMERRRLAEMAANSPSREDHVQARTQTENDDNDEDEESVIHMEFQEREVPSSQDDNERERSEDDMEIEDSTPSHSGPSIEVRLNVVQHIPAQLARHLLSNMPGGSEWTPPASASASAPPQQRTSSDGESGPSTGAPPPSSGSENLANVVQGMSQRMLGAVLSTMAGNEDAQAQMSLQQMFANASEGLVELDSENTVVSRLIECILERLTVVQAVQILQGDVGPLTQLQPNLIRFLQNEFNDGQDMTAEETFETVYEKMMDVLREYTTEFLIGTTSRRGISAQRTIMNVLKKPVHQVVTIICAEHDDPNAFGIAIKQWFRRTMGHLAQALAHSLEGGMASVETLLRRHILGPISTPLSGFSPSFQDFFYNIFLRQFVSAYINEYPCSQGELDAWAAATDDVPKEKKKKGKKSKEEPSVKSEPTREKIRAPNWVDAVPDELPEVSEQEEWHLVLPNEWIPVVTRDVETQKKMPPQRTLSDAYMNYVPAKRKKTEVRTVSADKAASQVVCEAISSSGLASGTPIEEISKAAAGASQLGAVYRRELDHQLRRRVLNDPDFDPAVFPSAAAAYANPAK